MMEMDEQRSEEGARLAAAFLASEPELTASKLGEMVAANIVFDLDTKPWNKRKAAPPVPANRPKGTIYVFINPLCLVFRADQSGGVELGDRSNGHDFNAMSFDHHRLSDAIRALPETDRRAAENRLYAVRAIAQALYNVRVAPLVAKSEKSWEPYIY